MATIKSISAREILDSRGNPTIETEVTFDDGSTGIAQVPSGASTGKYEALELRDGDGSRYHGKGVLKAVENVNEIIFPKLVGQDPGEQKEVDGIMLELDGTENKEELGANAILSVSIAYCKASAVFSGLELYEYIRSIFNSENTEYKIPIPLFNVINGGKHASNNLDIQEFWIIPQEIKSFKEQLRAGSEIFHTLKKLLEEKGFTTNVGDEGGYAPELKLNEEALEFIMQAIEKSGYKPGQEIFLGVDSAATSFYEGGKYILDGGKKKFSNEKLIDYYSKLIEKFPITKIEDGLFEDDFSGWKMLKEKLGDNIDLIGDDLLVTNPKRLEKAILEDCVNSVLIKPNQIGTITEMFEFVKKAQDKKFTTVTSHRSGDTEDVFISDLAVGMGTNNMKTGSLSRGERICKYNRLLRIEEKVKD